MIRGAVLAACLLAAGCQPGSASDTSGETAAGELSPAVSNLRAVFPAMSAGDIKTCGRVFGLINSSGDGGVNGPGQQMMVAAMQRVGTDLMSSISFDIEETDAGRNAVFYRGGIYESGLEPQHELSGGLLSSSETCGVALGEALAMAGEISMDVFASDFEASAGRPMTEEESLGFLIIGEFGERLVEESRDRIGICHTALMSEYGKLGPKDDALTLALPVWAAARHELQGVDHVEASRGTKTPNFTPRALVREGEVDTCMTTVEGLLQDYIAGVTDDAGE